ncbi:MAG: hypothetical protein JNK82_33420 [Myxococcaceae bacterium]|nr:hypothetical protein [Myxococcaceae bacterium]
MTTAKANRKWSDARLKGRLPPQLVRCPGADCGQYIYPGGKKCPHCGGVLVTLKRKQLGALRKAEAAAATLKRILEGL